MSKTQKKQALHVTEIKNAKNEVNILNAMGFNATLLSDIKGGIDNHSAHGKHKSYIDRKSTRLNSSHSQQSRMPSSA